MIKIVTPDNGCVTHTKFFVHETGEEIDLGAVSAKIDLKGYGHPVTASIEITLVRASAVFAQTTWEAVNPITGKLSAVDEIHYKDGTTVYFDKDGTPFVTKDTSLIAEGISRRVRVTDAEHRASE